MLRHAREIATTKTTALKTSVGKYTTLVPTFGHTILHLRVLVIDHPDHTEKFHKISNYAYRTHTHNAVVSQTNAAHICCIV